MWRFLKRLGIELSYDPAIPLLGIYHEETRTGGSDGEVSVYNEGDPGSIPGSGRSPGEGDGNPLQYSCLGNPMDREAPGWLQSMGLQRIGHDLVTKPPPPPSMVKTALPLQGAQIGTLIRSCILCIRAKKNLLLNN